MDILIINLKKWGYGALQIVFSIFLRANIHIVNEYE